VFNAERCLNFSAKRWAINVRREDLVDKSPEYLFKNCTVCSEHFESIMFLNDLHNRLQPTAVPTIVNVSNPPKFVAVQRTPPKRRNSDVISKGIKKPRKNTTTTAYQGL
jgi:hypothetical protein